MSKAILFLECASSEQLGNCPQELEVEKFITHSVPFSEINKAFDLMAKGEGIRCIIRMEH